MVLKKTPFSFLYEIGNAEKTDRNINDIGRNNNLDLYENIQEYEIPELGNFRIVSILLKGFSSTVCLCQWVLDLNETLTLCDYVRYINRNILNNNIQIVKGDHMEKREAISEWQDTTNIRSNRNMSTCIYPHIFKNAYVNINMDVQENNVNNLNEELEGVEYIYPSVKPNIYNKIININNNLEGYKNKREETKEISHIDMFTHSDIITKNNEITNHYDLIYEPYDIMKRKNKDTYNIQIMNLVLKIKHKGLHYKIKEIEQLREEIEIHQDLKHTNILQIILCAEDENDIWIFLEYSSIGTLYTYVGFNILQEKQVQIIICQILYALYYLHIKGIIHCDIKPQNLLLFNFDQSICIQNNFLLYDDTLKHLNMKKLNFQKLFNDNNDHKTNQQNNVFNNIVKICDFGLSVKCGFNEFFPYRGIKGSYGFIAPELFHECNFNNKIDMWALGIVTFILLGGYRPFYPCSKFQEKVTFHERYWFNISSEAKDFIQSLLQINPEKRLNVIEAIEHPWVKNYFMNS